MGVGRQFFLGLAEMGLEDRDVWAICGADVVQATDAATCRHLADCGSAGQEISRFVATLRQILTIHRLSRSVTTVIAFTPFYAWPVLRLICPGVRLVHVEQSKGGRHQELAAMRGRFGWKARLVQFAVALNFVFPHKIIFPSEGASRHFCEKNPFLTPLVRRKGSVIHNGISLPPLRRRLHGTAAFRIISICDDVPEKALDDCLQVISRLKANGCHVMLDHYGWVRDSTCRSAEANQLPVSFHGHRPRDEVMESLHGSDVFLHLPKVAVFDLVLIEAMSAGMPVVASPVGGNIEALGKDYPHFADGPESASAEILAIIKFPESATRIGQSLRARAQEHFTSVAMAVRYLET